MEARPGRRPDIEMAKGLAIVLVVFGHLVARADPAGVTWYEPLRRAVYTFHMPFFLYLSGLAMALSGAALRPLRDWPGFAKARAARLLLPFLALGVAVVLGKLAAAPVLHVDTAPASLGAGLAGLVWHTAASPALSVWYLAVLFVLSLATPLALRGKASRAAWVMAGAALLYAVPLPAYVYLDRVGRYAVFYAAGLCAGLWAGWDNALDRAWRLALLLLAALLAANAWCGAAWPPPAIMLPAGLLAMPALHGLVRHAPRRAAPALLWLGRYSFPIYLFNTPCIGLAKGLILRVGSWDAPHFSSVALALMAAGLLGPVALKRYILRHVPRLDRLTS